MDCSIEVKEDHGVHRQTVTYTITFSHRELAEAPDFRREQVIVSCGSEGVLYEPGNEALDALLARLSVVAATVRRARLEAHPGLRRGGR